MRMTLVLLPKAPSEVAWRMPPVMSMIEEVPPKLLAALVSTMVPAPALVKTTVAAPVAPPEIAPLKVSPWMRLELLAVATLKDGEVAVNVTALGTTSP